MTNALSGLDHKLHIVLNKADQFRKIHDFARAYGSLCWNLSKVIHRKDLPRIYTMCLPSLGTPVNLSSGQTEDAPSFSQGLADLEATREEVVNEVLNAPRRRVVNEISRIADSAALLHLHTSIISDILDKYASQVWKTRSIVAGTGLTSILVCGASLIGCFASDFASSAMGMSISIPTSAAASVTLVSALLSIGTVSWSHTHIERCARQLVDEDLIGGRVFGKIYAKRISERDESLLSMWHRVQDHLKSNTSSVSDREFLTMLLSSSGLKRKSDLRAIEKVMEVDVPALRRKAAPQFSK